MDKQQRIQLLFRKLKEAHQWCQQHPVMIQQDRDFFDNKLMPAVEGIYQELEELGINPTVGAIVFVFGVLPNDV
jgi:hypothetical protein